MSIDLTPGQSCFLYGWLFGKDVGKNTLTWSDIAQRPHFTFGFLMKAQIPLTSIHFLQEDLKKWVEQHKMEKGDILLALGVWDGDFVEIFKLDIGDLQFFQFSVEQLRHMHIDFPRMCDMGLTDENMFLFRHITLKGWHDLGLTRSVAQGFSDAHLYRCFKMRKNDVLNALK